MHPCRHELARISASAGGLLVAAVLLPGISVDRSRADEPKLRIRAAARWAPDAVLTGAAAARLSFWPSLDVGLVTPSSPAWFIDRVRATLALAQIGPARTSERRFGPEQCA